MSTLVQLRHGLTKAWDALTIGWRELRELAGDALTRFQPKASRSDVESAEERIVNRASRWGLLAAEVIDNGPDVEVMIEVPGLDPNDFDIEVRGDMLVVSGEKRLARVQTTGHYHLMERAYGRFERVVRLPASVSDEGAEATYHSGVLIVRLPKTTRSMARKIKVRAG